MFFFFPYFKLWLVYKARERGGGRGGGGMGGVLQAVILLFCLNKIHLV